MHAPPIFRIAFIVSLSHVVFSALASGLESDADSQESLCSDYDDYYAEDISGCSSRERRCDNKTIGEAVLGCRSTNVCTDGYRILTKEACKAAVSSLNLEYKFRYQETSCAWPTGCYYCDDLTGCSPKGAYFNKHPVGAATCGAQPVCMPVARATNTSLLTPVPTSVPTQAPTKCQQCLNDGSDYCISSNQCVQRALKRACISKSDHITGDAALGEKGHPMQCPQATTSAPTQVPNSAPTQVPTLATSAPTQVPTLATSAPTQVPTAKVVKVQTTITGVNYGALVSNITLLTSFKVSIKIAVLEEMDNSIKESDLEVELAPGSVVALITISGLIDPVAESAALQMKSSPSLAGNIATKVSEIHGISAVTIGTIGGNTQGVRSDTAEHEGNTESDADDGVLLLAVLSVTFCCLLCTMCLVVVVCAFRKASALRVTPDSVEPCKIPSTDEVRSFSVVPSLGSKGTNELKCPNPPLGGKDYHYFLSHKKTHSRLGKQPEALALSLHDSLSVLGYAGFFDVDNLKTISKEELGQSVKDSAVVVVCLHDETFQSEWCRLEWEVAEEHGIPIVCVADTDNFVKSDILAVCSSVGCLSLLKHQWIAYSNAHRKQAITEIAEWLEKCNAGAMRMAPSVVTAVHK